MILLIVITTSGQEYKYSIRKDLSFSRRHRCHHFTSTDVDSQIFCSHHCPHLSFPFLFLSESILLPPLNFRIYIIFLFRKNFILCFVFLFRGAPRSISSTTRQEEVSVNLETVAIICNTLLAVTITMSQLEKNRIQHVCQCFYVTEIKQYGL